MKNLLRRFLGLWLALVVPAFASQSPEVPTVKERAQGYREHRILAKPRAGHRATAEQTEQREGLRVRRAYPRMGDLRVLDLDAADSADAAIARLRATGRYEYVERDQLLYARLVPNDPSFSQQWALRNTGQSSGTSGADIGAVSGWDVQNAASNVVVAIVDSGMRMTHQDLAANLWSNASGYHGINAIVASGASGYRTPADDSGHGTHVAGIIGAVGNNGVGISGVAWGVKLMPLKFIDSSGSGDTSDAIECIDYAIANGAQIVNASYGSTGYSTAQFDAIKRARDAGIIFIAAAGNDGVNNDITVDYPSGYALDNIVSVASTTSLDQLAATSNYGPGSVDLAAPGANILSTYYSSDSSYQTLSGTSMAAPHVTGAVALLRARFPNESYRQIINRLLRGATRLATLSGKVQTGGRLNLAQALASTSTRPFNDDFASRAVVSGANIRIRSSNVDATSEAAEPVHAGVGKTGSLWWSWTPTESGQVFFDTTGSAYDTLLAVYTGADLGSLQLAGANDDASASSAASRVVLNVTANTTYHIAVAGKTTSTGLLLLKIGTVPANDDFAHARVLSGVDVKLSGTTINASRETNEPNPTSRTAGHSVWYRWTAPVTAHYSLAAFASNNDTVVAVYTGATVGTLTTIVANDNNQDSSNTDALAGFDAVAGTVYHLQIDHATDSSSPDGGDFILTLTDSLWEYPTLDEITSSPAVASDGTVYFGTGSDNKHDTRVYAVGSNGALKWRFTTGEYGIIGGTPAIGPDGTIYIGSTDKSLYALNPASGTKRWSYASTSALYAAPAIASDGTVYFRDDLKLYALTATGTLKWSYTINTPDTEGTYSSPVIGADGTIYVGNTQGKLYALTDQGTTGSLKWSYTADGDIYTSPTLASDGTIYFGTLAGSFYALTPGAASATKKWSVKLAVYEGADASITSSPALAVDGTIYFAAYDHKLYALNPATGTIKWSYTLGDEVRASSPAIAADGTVFVGAYDGLVYAVRPNGTLRRTYSTAMTVRSSPVIAGTRLYFGSADAKLHAFDLGQTAAASASPMFHGNPRRDGRVAAPLSITTQPVGATVAAGGSVTLTTVATGGSSLAYQWQRNGIALSGGTGSSLALTNLQPANTGLYTALVTGDTSLLSNPAIVGVTISTKTLGAATEVGSDIQHPNGKIYDQVLLQGPAAAVRADYNQNQVTRTSFIDLDNDIVQVEFSGPGTLSLVLDGASDPALPVNYNQAVNYEKGHVGIVIVGADEHTNVSVFTVGRATAVNQALFKNDVTYDGIADLAFIAIASTNGKFGGIRTANANYFASTGLTGIYAPGVAFEGPVYVGDLSAYDTARPAIIVGSVSDARITGGDLQQANGQPIQISGITKLKFTAGSDSHGNPLAAKTNQARLEQNGADVTSQIVSY